MNISNTVRDRAISSEFLTHRVVQEYPMQRGKISIFVTFDGHLGFLRKMKKCEYLGKSISSPLMLGGSGLVYKYIVHLLLGRL